MSSVILLASSPRQSIALVWLIRLRIFQTVSHWGMLHMPSTNVNIDQPVLPRYELFFFLFFTQDRLKIISKLPEKIKSELVKLNSTLNGKVGAPLVVLWSVLLF